ncbi:Glucose import ATP-binding protein GlcV [Candidatus Lokiarchaeum ossiferum]|uniref:Glucose import ATP-binding protein GlcV n=1 Tax=Candidatus Lokiarchaeum ossiferum TaxID=2951803 RepID=A0ABY6I126_9ARCH|nr:Glucose import ATP-binding protein GlcV [Candidatus Lokiarchaeum sp. B-35]
MDKTLKLNSLTKKYGSFLAVQDLSIEINPGIHAFLGPNGAGKSTTLLMILGLIKKNCGSVYYQNEILDPFTKGSKIFHRIGFLPENGDFYPNLSGEENLRLFFRLKGFNKKSIIKEKSIELLKWVNIPDSFWEKKTRTYSHGMKQRLALARAFIGNPDLIILDEPFQNLDPIGRDDIIHLIKKRYKKDSIIIFTTHETYEAEQLASDIAIFKSGQVVLNGKLNSIAGNMKHQNFSLEFSHKSQSIDEMKSFLKNQTNLISNLNLEADGIITFKTDQPEVINKLMLERNYCFDLRPQLGTLGKIYRDIINGGI